MNKSEDYKLNTIKQEVSKERRRKVSEMATILMKELLFPTKTNYQAMSYADMGKALGGIERSKIFRYANKQNLPPLEIAIKTINYVIENRNMLENLISAPKKPLIDKESRKKLLLFVKMGQCPLVVPKSPKIVYQS